MPFWKYGTLFAERQDQKRKDMANRQARWARELARREEETRMRQLLRNHKKTQMIDLTAAECRALAAVVYVWTALWPRYRNPRTRSICRFYRWAYQHAILEDQQVYGHPEDLVADLLRHRAGRLLLVYRAIHVQQLLYHGRIIRDLKSWTPHRGNDLDLMLAQLAEEWMGAYRHQLAPVIRQRLRQSVGQLRRPRLQSTWKFFLEQLAGHPLHRSAHLPENWILPASAQYALRRVPKSIGSLEAILEATYLLDRGVSRGHIEQLVGYHPFTLRADSFWERTHFWKWLRKNAGASARQVSDWHWFAMNWYDYLLDNQLGITPKDAYEVLDHYLQEKRMDPACPWVEEVWFAFCIGEVERMGRSFRLRGRNRDKLKKRYEAFYAQYICDLGSAEPEWEGAHFPAWSGNGPYRIIQLRSSAALKLEGILLQHCVGTYASLCRQGASSIWSLRYCPEGRTEEPLVTIELSRKGQIRQAYGKRNSAPQPEWLRMIADWQSSWT